MTCPICKTNNVSIVGNSHYICNNPTCVDNNGSRTQFYLEEDSRVRFPYNQIFVNRSKNNFYRKPYLKLSSVGKTEITK